MMKTSSKGGNIEHELLESEVASTLAHLAARKTDDNKDSSVSSDINKVAADSSKNGAPPPPQSSSSSPVVAFDDNNKSSSSVKKTPRSRGQQNHGQFHGTDTSHSNTGDTTTSSSQQKDIDHKSIEEDVRNAVTVGVLIKETVLRKLNRPEDVVKRNMFAIEGKSIKFPVKVSTLALPFQPPLRFQKRERKQILHVVLSPRFFFTSSRSSE